MLKVGKSQKQIFLPTILSKMPNSALASKIKSKNATFLLYSTVYLMLNVYHWLKDVQMVKISMYWRTLVWRCYGSNSMVLALVIGFCQDISLRKKNVNQKFSMKWQNPTKQGKELTCLYVYKLYTVYVPASTKVSTIISSDAINSLPSKYSQVVASSGLPTSSNEKKLSMKWAFHCREPIVQLPISSLYQIAFEPEFWSQCDLSFIGLGSRT